MEKVYRVQKTAVFLGLVLLAAACSREANTPMASADSLLVEQSVEETPTPDQPPTEELIVVNLEDLGPAPEIENEVWLNTERPLSLASQRGKVVLLEFWTFG